MLTDKQIDEIREHLENAKNPIFYYDNDADGLCSYILLRKYLGRGKGVAIRSYPTLDKGYARKAEELGADYVFVLDKPVLSDEFVLEIERLGLPFVWIDHHNVGNQDYSKMHSQFFIYNPSKNSGEDESDEPTTYFAYKVANRKEDLWIAVMGCIADHYLPDFAKEFSEEYKELWGNVKKPFDAYYGTEIGKIAQALNFGLKDSITNVVKMQNFLLKCINPTQVLEESKDNVSFRSKYDQLKKKYDSLLKKAEKCKKGNLLFFEYGGESSMSSEISNELSYKNQGVYIAVAFINGGITNISLRGNNVKKILANVIKEFENATGGGHEDAVGARIKTEDLNRFKEVLERELKS